MRDEDHVGVPGRLHGREGPAGPRRGDVGHLARPRGLLGVPAALQALDTALPPGRREVPALGEDQHRAVVTDVPGHRGDLDFGVTPARIDEAVGQAPAEDVDQRIHPQRFVEDQARPAAVPAEQLVEDQQRVALAGVAAQHDDRLPAGRQRLLGRLRLGDLDIDVRQAGHRAVDAAHEPAQHRIVRALHARRPRVPAEAAGDPQPQARQRARDVPGGEIDGDPEDPQRPPSAGQRRRQRRDQPEQRREKDDRDPGEQDERRDHQTTDRPGRNAHHDTPGPCCSR